MESKFKVFSTFQIYKTFNEIQIGRKIKILCFNGGEYIFLEFNKLYYEHGIQCQLFTLFTPLKTHGGF